MTLYDRLGYVELARSNLAMKYPNHPRTSVQYEINVSPYSDGDLSQIDRVFREATAGSYGFIHRPNNFLKARNHTIGLDINPKQKLRVTRREGMVSGYAYWESNPNLSSAHEILALDPSSFHALLADAEQRNPEAGILVRCSGLTKLEVGWLKGVGYEGPMESYGRAIIKSLTGKTDSEKMKTLYGVGLGNFRVGL
jgi:hypothetical protein